MRVLVLLFACGVARADVAASDAAEARALVDQWLAAQNQGNFAAYEKLYAARFTGVRRSGPRTVRLDRAGWMKDRTRMFAKPMVVSIESLKIAASPALSRATFVQKWASGSYSDAGDKQLVLVRESGALRISEEELLASRVEKRARSTELPPFVWVIGGRLRIVDDADEKWGKGAPELIDEEPILATKKLAKIPDEARGWLGEKVRLYTRDGSTCEAKVTGLELASLAVAHFSKRQEWSEQRKADAAKDAWELGEKTVLATLDAACEDALWARPAKLPAPAVVAGEDARAPTRASALKAFRALPAYQKIQQSWIEEEKKRDKKYWDQLDDASVKVFDATIGGKPATLVSVTAQHFDGCADWQGALWALYRLEAGKLKLINDPGDSTLTPLYAVDLDGDGTVELIGSALANDFGSSASRILFVDGKVHEIEPLRVPFYDCPC
jgi:hypothetical protein